MTKNVKSNPVEECDWGRGNRHCLKTPEVAWSGIKIYFSHNRVIELLLEYFQKNVPSGKVRVKN